MTPSRSLASVAALALVSCGSHSSAPSPGPAIASGSSPAPAPAPAPVTPAAPPAPSDSPGAKPAEPAAPAAGPRPSDAELAKLTRANNAFAFALWRKVAPGKGDFAYSPFSAQTALAMTWLGARGKTAAQMQKVLGWTEPAADAADIAGRYTRSLGGPVTIRVANRLFGENTYAFERGFLDATARSFGAPLEPLDFKGAPEPSRVHINQWVAGETRDRIKDLIPAGEITGETRLALVNAIYFLGDWAAPFKKEATRPEAFHTSATDKRDVAMMHQRLHAMFADDGAVSVLDLPYADGGFAMTFVLPRKLDGLAAVEARLSAEGFARWSAAQTRTDVVVALPKFTIDPPEPMRLGAALASLGMTDAFDRRAADFTGIANPPSPDDRLVLSKVFHKAFVKVDEKGTEAAAATAAVMVRAGAARPTEPPKQFRADHPFLFFLRDARTGTILFAGRVADPVVK